MMAIGIASYVQTVATSLSAMFVIRLVVEFGGDVALSAFGIIQRVMMFAFMPGIVLGQGVQPILGYNFGARRFGLAIKSLTMAFVAATLFSFVAFFVLYFLPRPIVSVFTSDASVIDSAVATARHVFVALPIIGTAMVGASSFQSLGKATQAFITAIVRPVGFLIPAALILPRFLQLEGVWYAFPVADGLTFVLTVILTIPIIREFRRAAASSKTTEKQLVEAAVR